MYRRFGAFLRFRSARRVDILYEFLIPRLAGYRFALPLGHAFSKVPTDPASLARR